MRIGEVVKATGMSKDGIRHYEQLGLISSSPRSAGSRIYRDYDRTVIEMIDQVHQGQRLGLTLKELVPLLKAYRSGPPSVEQTLAFLEQRLVAIRQKQAELREVELFICEKIGRYRAASNNFEPKLERT